MNLLSVQAGIDVPDPIDDATAVTLLEHGALDVIGRMPWSSNATFLVRIDAEALDTPDTPDVGDAAMLAIYKPQRGERPLWDFPDGSLAEREVAARVISELLGWSLVPHTVLRDGPLGIGAVSRFFDHDPEQHYFELLAGREDTFRRFAAFDAVINNTDRKGGHVLLDPAGHVWGIDHGTCFHVHPKLRTVIWEFAGEPIAPALLGDLECLLARLGGADEGDDGGFATLLAPSEVDATLDRTRSLLRRGRYPLPSGDYHDYPWPTI